MNEREQPAAADRSPSSASLRVVPGSTSFDEAWQRHERQVAKWARRICARLGVADEAPDVVQEVSLDLLQTYASGAPPQRINGFLRRVTHRRAVDRLRGEARRSRLAAAATQAGEASEAWLAPLIGALAERDPLADPEAAAIAASFRSTLVELVDQLPEKHRDAVMLVDLRGATIAEAAAALQVPEGTVKTWARAGRQALRTSLSSRGWTADGDEP